RTAYELVTGATLFSLDFEEVRGLEGVKEASVNLAGTELKVAVAHGLGNARKLLDAVVNGEKECHFIEIMCCPGGCIGGGGQPAPVHNDTLARRIAAIYQVDRQMPLRKSHENPAVQALYREFLGEPLSHKSHELLHTHYTPRERF
ncbi:iron hydrogenase small subunit, partial [Desulfofundulus sp.]|uniref:iron hydrogenase small subunit n=1 Tax=Desulfofundulus sp. TaxID=2282750 RepID=UPI003C728C41